MTPKKVSVFLNFFLPFFSRFEKEQIKNSDAISRRNNPVWFPNALIIQQMLLLPHPKNKKIATMDPKM